MQSLNFDLSGKVALVTGAGRGLGLGIARALAAHGASVAVQDIDLPVARDAARQIQADGGRAIAVGGDITDLATCPPMVEQTVAAFDGLHILVNNASIQKRAKWWEVDPADALTVWTANLLAPLRLCQLVHERFRRQQWGRIINISSVQVRNKVTDMLPYSTSKVALEYLTRSLARDLAADGVTVNAIAPGWMDTYRNRNDWTDERDKVESGKRIPAGRIGTPDDVAGAALLLASDAGAYIVGETLYVTGGI